VIAALALDETGLRFIEEPPGFLCEIRAATALRNTNIKVPVEIRLRPHLDLRSTSGRWDPVKVRAARVTGVSIDGKGWVLATLVPRDPSVPRYTIPPKRSERVYGASWLGIRGNRLGVRYHTSINRDRIVIYTLSPRGMEEVATWSVPADSVRGLGRESCVFSESGRTVYYLTETQVRAHRLGAFPVDVALLQLKDRDWYWERLVVKPNELFGLGHNERTNQLQLTTLQRAWRDGGRSESRPVRSDVLEHTGRLQIIGATADWLYLVDTDQPPTTMRLEALDLWKDRTRVLADLGARPSAGATSSCQRLALGTFSGRVHLVDLKTQQHLRELDPGDRRTVGAVSWSADGDYLAAGLLGKGDQLVVYRAPFREKLFSVRVAEHGCERVALSDDGEWVAGYGTDHVIRVWKVPTER
jgi:hypothetical protein